MFSILVLHVNKSLQVNLFIAGGPSPFSFFNPNFKTVNDTMYPIMWAFESSVITADLAGEIKSKLYVTLNVQVSDIMILSVTLQRVIVPVFVPFGVVFALLGLALAVIMGHLDYRLAVRRAHFEYSPINAEE